MSSRLHLQNFEDVAPKTPALVIPMRPVDKKSHKQRENGSKVKADKEIPLFYTEPIFKPKKYDFL